MGSFAACSGQSAHTGGETLKKIQTQYFGVAEAATMTGTSAWFWRKRAYAGQISSVKFGTRLLIPRSEIERIIRENTRPRLAKQSGGK
jgi:hypothetical protein